MLKKQSLQIKTRSLVALSSLVFLIIGGTTFFHWIEDWTWAESFYFSVATLTTVGYGDLHPTTDTTRVATAIFILLGVTVAVTAVSMIGSAYINRRALIRENKRERR